MEPKLLKKIERLRKKLNKIGKNGNLFDPEVVEVSRQLDILLNKYSELRRNQQLSFW
ncbi:MAG: aspartyl-phosphate phosphatase Spo0E family protein [Desulfitobacteriaceae bacterium]|nr:aspartyl-phosphate phosphatase Spo0E family protein [Desulfitobacteriaceae bacterium]MDD4347052.1 aspartyl-phosphate phosphatase Spo0E family protein [Desulfitobacteriaceae bacterium]MDD4402321.1 aspartyl-phosphate phosphatase Spo0E family protein [Desulfitobacteriaceae bacterium]